MVIGSRRQLLWEGVSPVDLIIEKRIADAVELCQLGNSLDPCSRVF